MNDQYILVEGKPVLEPNLNKWGSWMGTSERIVKKDDIGKVKVSTIFLGLDHNYGIGTPILWETMIFGGKHDQYQKRYSSLEDAQHGHKYAIDLVNSSSKK